MSGEEKVRRAFYSFHFAGDAWRVSQVRNIGKVMDNKPVSDNNWEEVKKGGEKRIKEWIDEQLENRSVAVVLIGAKTAERKWVKYEIKRAWEKRLGVVGVRIHGLKDQDCQTSTYGENPFAKLTVDDGPLDKIVKTYNPEGKDSAEVYNSIRKNLPDWVEEGISIRGEYKDAKSV